MLGRGEDVLNIHTFFSQTTTHLKFRLKILASVQRFLYGLYLIKIFKLKTYTHNLIPLSQFYFFQILQIFTLNLKKIRDCTLTW